MMLEQRELVLPEPALWPEGIDELEAFEFTVLDSGGVRSGAPAGCHDDCVIALALARVIPINPVVVARNTTTVIVGLAIVYFAGLFWFATVADVDARHAAL